MGMAASQARLLSLTSRLHDVEFKAQNIMAQKVALSTQKDELYQEYCEALDATSIKVAFQDGLEKNYIDANFSTLCKFNNTRINDYALRDNRSGLIIVSEDVKENYDKYRDKYCFAWAMLGFGNSFGWNSESAKQGGLYIGIGREQDQGEYTGGGSTGYSTYLTEAEAEVFESARLTDDGVLDSLYEKIEEAETPEEKEEALKRFRDELYKTCPNEIFAMMNCNKQDDKVSAIQNGDVINEDLSWEKIADEFNYYVSIWEGINNAGGCTAIDPLYESGEEGTIWFKNMVESGMVTIMAYDLNGHANEWSDTSVATSTSNNHLQEVQDDRELKKAEAEYEHELSIINDKDTKFDNELSKLETERKSITTEMESIKKVRDENVERTFGIFS